MRPQMSSDESHAGLGSLAMELDVRDDNNSACSVDEPLTPRKPLPPNSICISLSRLVQLASVSPTVFLKLETCDHYIKNHYILVAKDPKKEVWVFAPTFIDFHWVLVIFTPVSIDARWALLVFVLAYMDVR